MQSAKKHLSALEAAIDDAANGESNLPRALATIEQVVAGSHATLERLAVDMASRFERVLQTQQASFERMLQLRLVVGSPQAASLDASLARTRAVAATGGAHAPNQPAADHGEGGRPGAFEPDEKVVAVSHERILAATDAMAGGASGGGFPIPR